MTLTVDASGLSSGTYSGQVRVDAPGTANNPLLLPVTLNVSANGFLVVSPAELGFNFQIGMAAPAFSDVEPHHHRRHGGVQRANAD